MTIENAAGPHTALVNHDCTGAGVLMVPVLAGRGVCVRIQSIGSRNAADNLIRIETNNGTPVIVWSGTVDPTDQDLHPPPGPLYAPNGETLRVVSSVNGVDMSYKWDYV